MKELASGIIISVVSMVGGYYAIREIESNFWRTKRYYGLAKQAASRKFKHA